MHTPIFIKWNENNKSTQKEENMIAMHNTQE
jgi:hypothetical protein